MQRTQQSVEEYLASLPEPAAKEVRQLHEEIMKEMSGLTPEIWEGVFWGGSQQRIIGYGTITQSRSDKRTVEWFMVGLSAQKNYLSVYISAVEDGQYVTKKYGAGVGKVTVGSSSISFKKLADISVPALMELVKKAFIQLPAA